jgi:hypothetical protein
MKRLSCLFLFVLLAVRVLATDGAMLASIAVEENWQGRVGRAGEIGPYQMLPSTRADRRRDLRARGVMNPTELQLATEHLNWIRKQLKAAGVPPEPFNLALCWNAGGAGTVTGRAPVASYHYAGRVVAILEQRRAGK